MRDREREFRELIQHAQPKTFREWWRYHIWPNRHLWDELFRRRILTFFSYSEEEFRLFINRDEVLRASDEVKSLMDITLQGAASDRQSVLLMALAVGHGLKLFCPSAEQCEAFERVDPKFPPSEYRQPFPTFCIEFPPDYGRRKMVRGDSRMFGPGVEQLPLGVIAHHDVEQQALLLHIVLSTTAALTNTIDLRRDTETLHDRLQKCRHINCDGVVFDHNREEGELIYLVTRLVVNACSLLVHFGCQRLKGSPEENKEKNRLQRNAKHARQDVRLAAQTDVRCHPVCYGFDQTIRLYERVTQSTPEGSGGGWTVSPHWRMGSWVMQPCGPGSTQRKKIFRCPVLVNAHLLKGPQSNTTVTVRP